MQRLWEELSVLLNLLSLPRRISEPSRILFYFNSACWISEEFLCLNGWMCNKFALLWSVNNSQCNCFTCVNKVRGGRGNWFSGSDMLRVIESTRAADQSQMCVKHHVMENEYWMTGEISRASERRGIFSSSKSHLLYMWNVHLGVDTL